MLCRMANFRYKANFKKDLAAVLIFIVTLPGRSDGRIFSVVGMYSDVTGNIHRIALAHI